MSKSSHRTAWLGATLLCAASAMGSAGCAVADMAEEAWFQTQTDRSPPAPPAISTRRSTSPTTGARSANSAAPTRTPLEDDEDWYRKWFMSTKAREVERNLGIE